MMRIEFDGAIAIRKPVNPQAGLQARPIPCKMPSERMLTMPDGITHGNKDVLFKHACFSAGVFFCIIERELEN